MSRSTKTFERWTAHESSTWSFHMYLKYNVELIGLQTAHSIASSKIYKYLGSSKLKWTDKSEDIFGKGDKFVTMYPTLKDWSDSYHHFDNWVNLSSTLTAASNLETYLASVIRLAIDSDPGVLIGASRHIDGAHLLKANRASRLDVETHITNCTKGDWSARLSAFERIFGEVPDDVRTAHSDLEALRGIRNRFGHAFGRDIDIARRNGVKTIVEMEKISRERSNKLRHAATKVAKSIDRFLLEKHIGDFEVIQFYAATGPIPNDKRPLGERAVILKNSIGKIGALSRGKTYCQGLIRYWDSIA